VKPFLKPVKRKSQRDVQFSEAVYPIWSGFSRFWTSSAHSSGQVLMFQGKIGSGFGSFTTYQEAISGRGGAPGTSPHLMHKLTQRYN